MFFLRCYPKPVHGPEPDQSEPESGRDDSSVWEFGADPAEGYDPSEEDESWVASLPSDEDLEAMAGDVDAARLIYEMIDSYDAVEESAAWREDD